ncbi:unnamed protein product, partial [Schistocephalus solidus]|uniref:RNA-binding protein 42 n=1 Tax=Schistocephalus solidus TaxID=70667 RepID=A0A183TCI2_SCHSO
FEAEIASQPGPPVAPQIAGGFVYGQSLPFATPVNHYAMPLLSAPGVYMSSFAAIPPSLPPTYSMPSVITRKPVEKTPPPTVSATAKTVISAPPQMAGPEELAARAKETAAAAEAAKLNALEADDDDVTRALLAAEAGVTYTRTTGPNGKESVKANVSQPPRSQPPPKPAPPPTPVVASAPETAVPPPPPPIYSIRLDTSVPPPDSPMPVVRHTQTTTEEPYSFQKKVYRRVAAGMVWEDPTLAEWDPSSTYFFNLLCCLKSNVLKFVKTKLDDFRLFCGDLGNEVSDDTLTRAFSRYPSFQKAKVIVDKRSGKSRGYGFVSFSDPSDFTRAIREMNGVFLPSHFAVLYKYTYMRKTTSEKIKKFGMAISCL